MVHVAVNKYDFEKINILEYAFGEGGGGHQKAYAVYAFINVDNCERPLMQSGVLFVYTYGCIHTIHAKCVTCGLNFRIMKTNK